jgi:hypothetical protein
MGGVSLAVLSPLGTPTGVQRACSDYDRAWRQSAGQSPYHGPGAPPLHATSQPTVSSTTSSTSTLNTYYPSMSYLEPSTSFLRFKGRIGRGAMSGDSQRQRYASLVLVLLISFMG